MPGGSAGDVLLRVEDGEVPADDLILRVAVDRLRTGVPGHDAAVWIQHEDRVVDRAGDQQSELPILRHPIAGALHGTAPYASKVHAGCSTTRRRRMIKVLAPALRHPTNRSLEDFHRYWGESHGPLFANTKALRGYVQHLTLPEAYEGQPEPTFDGVSMFWYDDLETMGVETNDPDVLALMEGDLRRAGRPQRSAAGGPRPARGHAPARGPQGRRAALRPLHDVADAPQARGGRRRGARASSTGRRRRRWSRRSSWPRRCPG